MAVKIRLTRRGRRNSPYYRLVIADSRKARDGRFIESLGIYHPLKTDANEQLRIDEDKAIKWLHQGATPSDTVRSLLRRKGIMKRYHEEKLAARKRRAEAG